ncbi:hypothetical protein [Pelagicoccus sp. SDUM812003]|uniref:CAF17-like 4Fe-4S cluster assembly/insertion protein YgfZ n=1 Tax=Pelagicoccus sp. SDUM812003 TaxID=3041267 RepID=UPI00280C7D92|nr:hypothetical protein [Pelagicoccus sp. SDUM812003]MDQ8203367.1 hypothetical protein [Pelagicoccus sp. SDUM812003]
MAVSHYHLFTPACVLEAKGPDARGFLQGQFSNDLGPARQGDCVYGLWLDRKGKIVADSFVLCRADDDFLLISYYSDERRIRQRLEDYLIMDDVELRGLSAQSRGCSLWGERPVELLAKTDAPPPEPGRWKAYGDVVAFWGRRGAAPVLEVLEFSRGMPENRIDDMVTNLSRVGAAALSLSDLGRLAIEGKVPRIGIAFGDTDLPQELGLHEDAVSFNKGCYLGQEVMARLHSMGRARKGLVRARCAEQGALEIDPPIELRDADGKKQGQIRELSYSDRGALALAIVSLGYAGESLMAGDRTFVLERD